MGNDDWQYSYCFSLNYIVCLSPVYISYVFICLSRLKWTRSGLDNHEHITVRQIAINKPDLYFVFHWFYLFIFIKSIRKELSGLTERFSYLRQNYDGTDLFPVILEFRRQSWRRNHWPVGWELIPDTRITEWPTTANCYLSELLFPYTLDSI